MASEDRATTSASKIRVLPRDVVSKIAAGEVIERPASVVKELVENALDAGATRIDIEIRGAPGVFLSVEDNGCGMTPEEAAIAFERHSTSKISSEEDLSRVATLGFRGEALPSIAAVSRLEVWTQAKGARSGVRLTLSEGKKESEEEIAMAEGTRIEVRDLFHNLPVRKKFLSSPETELRHVLRFVEACALSHGAVFFKILRDGDPVISVPPSDDLRDRVSAIHGHRLASGMIPFRHSSSDVTVRGLVGKPEATRSNRSAMVFSVNGRWISSPLLAKAVRDAYGDLLPPGRFPAAFVLIDSEPGLIDANVHPAKREVRFSPRARIYETVRGAVAGELSEHAPELWPSSDGRTERGPASVPSKQQSLGLGEPGHGPSGSSSGGGLTGARIDGEFAARRSPGAAAARGAMNLYGGAGSVGEERGGVGPRHLWQVHGSYICGQTRSGLVIIDQHAAHERILYEGALAAMKENRGSSQQLLFPQLMDLSAAEYDTLLEMLPNLERLGFDIRSLSNRSIAVYGIPADAREWRDGRMLCDMIEEYASSGKSEKDHNDAVAKSYACHAAIKAGQSLDPEEMNALIDQLFATGVPHGDPHGRPTYLQISLAELERRFGRS